MLSSTRKLLGFAIVKVDVRAMLSDPVNEGRQTIIFTSGISMTALLTLPPTMEKSRKGIKENKEPDQVINDIEGKI